MGGCPSTPHTPAQAHLVQNDGRACGAVIAQHHLLAFALIVLVVVSILSSVSKMLSSHFLRWERSQDMSFRKSAHANNSPRYRGTQASGSASPTMTTLKRVPN
jgi:hypothetical protein